MAALEVPRAWVVHHRGPLITAFCGAVGVVLALLGISLPWQLRSTPPSLAVMLVFLIGILVIHLGRQRWPLTVLALGTALAVVEVLTTGTSGIGVIILLSDLAYAAALYSPSRIVDAIAFACTALAVGTAGLFAVIALTDSIQVDADAAGGLVFGWLVTVPVLFASSIWFGRLVRFPRLEAQRERERADATERAAAALRQDAVTRERLELSRELHDVIAGHLSAIAMQSTAALERRDIEGPAPYRQSLELIRASSIDALTDMRTMIDVLRGDPLADGPASALGRLTAEGLARAVEVAETNGLAVTVALPRADALDAVPQQASIVGMRTIVEGLTNAAKHAPRSRVRIEVTIADGLLGVAMLNPTDDLPGVTGVPVSGGVGLVGLAERARLAGGELTAGPDGAGWRTVLRVPVGAPSRLPDVVSSAVVS